MGRNHLRYHWIFFAIKKALGWFDFFNEIRQLMDPMVWILTRRYSNILFGWPARWWLKCWKFSGIPILPILQLMYSEYNPVDGCHHQVSVWRQSHPLGESPHLVCSAVADWHSHPAALSPPSRQWRSLKTSEACSEGAKNTKRKETVPRTWKTLWIHEWEWPQPVAGWSSAKTFEIGNG